MDWRGRSEGTCSRCMDGGTEAGSSSAGESVYTGSERGMKSRVNNQMIELYFTRKSRLTRKLIETLLMFPALTSFGILAGGKTESPPPLAGGFVGGFVGGLVGGILPSLQSPATQIRFAPQVVPGRAGCAPRVVTPLVHMRYWQRF